MGKHAFVLTEYRCAECLLRVSAVPVTSVAVSAAEKALQVQSCAREHSTMAGHVTSLNHLQRCAAALGVELLPMSEELMKIAFSWFLSCGKSLSVCSGIWSTVAVWHSVRELPSPFESASASLWWDGLKRLAYAQVKHYAEFPHEKWVYMIRTLVARGTLIDLRDAVWLCLGYLAFSRHSEVSGRKHEPEFARGFRFCDVDLSRADRVRLKVRASKQDPDGRGAYKVVSARTRSGVNFRSILLRYYALLGLTVSQAAACELPLIQPTGIRATPHVGARRFRVDRRFKQLQLQMFGAALYTFHCLRVGGSTHALACGVHPSLGKAHGLWSSESYWLYARFRDDARLGVTSAM